MEPDDGLGRKVMMSTGTVPVEGGNPIELGIPVAELLIEGCEDYFVLNKSELLSMTWGPTEFIFGAAELSLQEPWARTGREIEIRFCGLTRLHGEIDFEDPQGATDIDDFVIEAAEYGFRIRELVLGPMTIDLIFSRIVISSKSHK